MKRKIPLLLLCLLFLGIAIYAGISLWKQWQEYKVGEEAYGSLSQYIQLAEPPPMATEQTSPPGTDLKTAEPTRDTLPTEAETLDEIVWPTVDFGSLQAINSDVVAWVYLEGTLINYPVVQGSNNSEYLYRLVDGTSNSAGSIFMDYRNQPNISDRHTVLYGHHMKNDSMFAAITRYKEQSFYDEHPSCLILTPDGNYKLEFFAGYVANLNDESWKLEFESDEEYGAWLEQAIVNSTFESDIIPTPQDRVVTLSTCTYEYDDARYVLLGILKDQS